MIGWLFPYCGRYTHHACTNGQSARLLVGVLLAIGGGSLLVLLVLSVVIGLRAELVGHRRTVLRLRWRQSYARFRREQATLLAEQDSASAFGAIGRELADEADDDGDDADLTIRLR